MKRLFVADWVRNTIRERQVDEANQWDAYSHKHGFDTYMEAVEWMLIKRRHQINRLQKELEEAMKRFNQILERSGYGDEVLPLKMYRMSDLSTPINTEPIIVDRDKMIRSYGSRL